MAWSAPAGKKLVEKGSGIAGNAVITKTVAAGKIWLPLNVCVTLTTDATVVNRYVQVYIRDIVDVNKFVNESDVITASLAKTKAFNRNVSATGSAVNALGEQYLGAGEDIYLVISGGVAGDSYVYAIEYLEIAVSQ